METDEAFTVDDLLVLAARLGECIDRADASKVLDEYEIRKRPLEA